MKQCCDLVNENIDVRQLTSQRVTAFVGNLTLKYYIA